MMNNFRICIKLLKLVTSEDPAGKQCVEQRCWDFTCSAMYYNVRFEWEGGVQEHNIFMYYLYHLRKKQLN